MKTFTQVYAALRRKNKGQYALLSGCCFFSVLLITAYVCMMRSPTILSVLPEGGDSRKQVMMVFVLAVIGCAVFTTYAAGLFFRQKSRETGVFLALGASRRQLQAELGKELALISLCSCTAGAILGGPLAWGIWQLFRLFLVDSQEMVLTFDPEAYLLSLIFAAYVVVMLFLLGGRAVRRTNIIDIVQERLDFAKKMGVEHTINSKEVDAVEKVREITGEGAQLVMECSGANPAIRQTFDLVSNAGRITLTGWPKKETSLPTDVITKKEIDIRGARTSAGEFEEALDLINSRKVDMMKILTKTVTMDEAPDTIVDIEKNPGNYMKVVVRVSNDD